MSTPGESAPRPPRRHAGAQAPLRLALIARFVASGGTVFVVNVTLMALLTKLLGLPTQIALVLAFACATAVHFVLNSRVVFAGPAGYHHGRRAQVLRYLGLASLSYAGTALGTALLPEATGLATFPAYLISISFMAVLIFACLRALVFTWRSPAG